KDYAFRACHSRRLHGRPARRRRTGIGGSPVPNHREDLDLVGDRGSWRDCRRRAGPGRRCDEVWPAMSATVIETKGLAKRYGTAVAVAGIDLSVQAGEVIGLLGPNGAGKTTTILMLLGLTEPSEGSVRILAKDPLRQPLEVKREVGYLPDAVGFYDSMT